MNINNDISKNSQDCYGGLEWSPASLPIWEKKYPGLNALIKRLIKKDLTSKFVLEYSGLKTYQQLMDWDQRIFVERKKGGDKRHWKRHSIVDVFVFYLFKKAKNHGVDLLTIQKTYDPEREMWLFKDFYDMLSWQGCFIALLYGYPTFLIADFESKVLTMEFKNQGDEEDSVSATTVEGRLISSPVIFSLSGLLDSFVGAGLNINGFEIRVEDGRYSYTIDNIPLRLEPLCTDVFGERPNRSKEVKS